MLKYQINTNNSQKNLIPIDISDFKIENIIKDIDDNGEITYDDKQLLVCYCDNEIPFDENANITVMSERYMINDDNISSTPYNFDTIYKLTSVNKENRSFTLTFNKYINLEVSETKSITDEEGNEWWYIYFNGSHLFNMESKLYSEDDTEIYQALYLTFDGINGQYKENPVKFTISASVKDNDTAGEWLNSSVIRIKKGAIDIINGLKEISDHAALLNFFTDNFIFVSDNFTLYIDKPLARLHIPLLQKFSTDLMQDSAIRDNFTEVEKAKAINHITEMEKDVYYPVICINNEIQDVYKIKFNLHFREHKGDNWLVENDSYWNGVNVDNKGNISLLGNYFVYGNNDYRISCQPDLLTYLNFTDKDVRYQKNKLKKSFLRVMFFDSMNPTNQNMLAYYTVFMDSGLYFSKYARYIEKEGYYNTDDETKHKKIGIKVNREPSQTSKLSDINNTTDIDEIEEVRLGSQFVIQDKYMSDASSEGFYLYLWKDNMNGQIPTDIYMKVEFNHAGYGRTIPFMMPFWDKEKDKKEGTKTFQDIIDDWNDENNRYGIRKYLKYSYIHFKYRYDKNTARHIYYMDDEFYGKEKPEDGGVNFEDNTVTLNLYEAKII